MPQTTLARQLSPYAHSGRESFTPLSSEHSTPASRAFNLGRVPKMSNPGRLLAELIALPSVNPAFLPANDPRAGEQRVGDFLAAIAGCSGLEVEFQEVFPDRANLLARMMPSGRARQRILLAPHLDTVSG